MTTPNITADEDDELSKRKKRGNTTTEDNAKFDQYYWQTALAMQELDADILVKLIYYDSPLIDYVSLVYIYNKTIPNKTIQNSAKFIERTATVKKASTH